jgi:D-alanyl-D-alanine carboxypeptidase
MAGLDEAFERLDRFVEQRLAQAGTPGLALALTDRDRVLSVRCYGVTDLAAGTPVTPETLFEIGSIGKSFTGVVVQQLREEGLLDLDAPVTDYLPWFAVRPAFGPITLGHLLSHTAGIIRGADVTSDSRWDAWALRETDVGAPPGERFHYSNVGYRVIGHLLEEVLGRSYPGIVAGRVLGPLGMKSSVPAITNEIRRYLATGYEYAFDDRPPALGAPLAAATWLETGTADGSIASTATDMTSFVRMLLNGGRGPGGPLISQESIELMGRSVIATEDEGVSYGYGLASMDMDGRRVLGHGGSMVGYASDLHADMDEGVGVVVLINGPDRGDYTHTVAAFALRLLRAALQGGALPAVPPPDDPFVVADAADFAGTYTTENATQLTFDAEDDRLFLRHGDLRVTVERRSGDRFHADLPAFALFDLIFRRAKRRVTAVTRGAFEYVREGETPPDGPIEPPPEWQAYPGHYRSYNPWLTNFRVVLRGADLVLIHAFGAEEPLTPIADGLYRVGADERSPERISFDAVLDGRALRANLSGCEYYRVFTP